MASSAVDNWTVGHILAVVDEDGPDIDEGEQGDVRQLLQREKEREDVVGQALAPAIDWVKGVTCVGCWHDPFVVWLVERLVHTWMVEAAVDEVDEAVGEEEEEGELEEVVQWERRVGPNVVQFAVSADFGRHERACQD